MLFLLYYNQSNAQHMDPAVDDPLKPILDEGAKVKLLSISKGDGYRRLIVMVRADSIPQALLDRSSGFWSHTYEAMAFEVGELIGESLSTSKEAFLEFSNEASRMAPQDRWDI